MEKINWVKASGKLLRILPFLLALAPSESKAITSDEILQYLETRANQKTENAVHDEELQLIEDKFIEDVRSYLRLEKNYHQVHKKDESYYRTAPHDPKEKAEPQVDYDRKNPPAHIQAKNQLRKSLETFLKSHPAVAEAKNIDSLEKGKTRLNAGSSASTSSDSEDDTCELKLTVTQEKVSPAVVKTQTDIEKISKKQAESKSSESGESDESGDAWDRMEKREGVDQIRKWRVDPKQSVFQEQVAKDFEEQVKNAEKARAKKPVKLKDWLDTMNSQIQEMTELSERQLARINEVASGESKNARAYALNADFVKTKIRRYVDLKAGLEALSKKHKSAELIPARDKLRKLEASVRYLHKTFLQERGFSDRPKN